MQCRLSLCCLCFARANALDKVGVHLAGQRKHRDHFPDYFISRSALEIEVYPFRIEILTEPGQRCLPLRTNQLLERRIVAEGLKL